jgi:hypothetical protein
MLESIIDDVDAIFLTDYLYDDANYFMGDEWRDILINPRSHSNKFIGENFEYKEEYIIQSSESFHNKVGKAVLFVRK